MQALAASCEELRARTGNPPLGADYMDRASPVNRAEKCHENLPWAAK